MHIKYSICIYQIEGILADKSISLLGMVPFNVDLKKNQPKYHFLSLSQQRPMDMDMGM